MGALIVGAACVVVATARSSAVRTATAPMIECAWFSIGSPSANGAVAAAMTAAPTVGASVMTVGADAWGAGRWILASDARITPIATAAGARGGRVLENAALVVRSDRFALPT